MYILKVKGITIDYDPDYNDEIYFTKDKNSLMMDLKTLKEIIRVIEIAKNDEGE
jgi:hypothetical protein